MSTLQFVDIGIHPPSLNVAFGGLQDDAKAKYDGTGWMGLDTDDRGYSDIDHFDLTIWYSTRCTLRGSCVQFQRNTKGGTAPLEDWPQRSQGIDINDRM